MVVVGERKAHAPRGLRTGGRLFRAGVGGSFRNGSGSLMHFFTGGEIAYDDLAIALLREERVSQVFAIAGKRFARNGLPVVVIVVI